MKLRLSPFPLGVLLLLIVLMLLNVFMSNMKTPRLKFGNMFNCWLPNSDNFALYFYQQWVVGEFKEWQTFRSSPGVATTNNAVESLNATLKKYFTCHKRLKLGECFMLCDMFIKCLYTVINLFFLFGFYMVYIR